MEKKVKVKYHNMFGGESDRGNNGEREYEITIPSNGEIRQDLETVFRYMNHVDGDPDGVEQQLRTFRERSMSVGDSCIIDGRTFVCAMVGWEEQDAEGDRTPVVKEIPRTEVPANHKHDAIPADNEVRPLPDGEEPKGKATCGYCGLSWDDSIPTSMTPAPSARCPFEYFHRHEETPNRMKDKLNLKAIITAYAESAGTDIRGAIRDCVTDCQHLAVAEGLDFDQILFGANEVYREEAELDEGEGPMRIEHSVTDDGQHRIKVESHRIECDSLMFVFTHEGIIVDAVTGGVVDGSQSRMYETFEEEMTDDTDDDDSTESEGRH